MELIRVQDSDYKKAYDLFMTFERDENGFMNPVYGYDYQKFLEWIEMKKDWSMGKNLPEGFVPDTTFVLEDEDRYVAIFNLRHCLNDFLREGPGHIGYGVSKDYRGKGYATKGLKLALAEARKINIHEVFLSANKDNVASWKAQLANGAYIHHSDDKKYYTRINQINDKKTRQEIINGFYSAYEEDDRLERTVHGKLEFATTMHYIHEFVKQDSKVLEIGAGTGRYSIALAKEGFDVTSVELVEKNLETLKANSKGLKNLCAIRGDATDLGELKDNTFDTTLVLGPMYHLYDPKEVYKAIDEAIRVTKPTGVILFAFISIYAIMYSNYFYGNWAYGEEENFDKEYKVKHFKEQLFTGYDIEEFEALFKEKNVDWITTAGVDALLEPIEHRVDFGLSESDFERFCKWYLQFAEKRELLGATNHLLYICKKRKN